MIRSDEVLRDRGGFLLRRGKETRTEMRGRRPRGDTGRVWRCASQPGGTTGRRPHRLLKARPPPPLQPPEGAGPAGTSVLDL